jgi:predicted DNA-binding transcriptional regulator AlpA
MKVRPEPVAPTDVALSHRAMNLLINRIALRLDEVARALGVSRRSIERERSAGRFPKPDLHVGRMPLWKPETLQRWIEDGGRA